MSDELKGPQSNEKETEEFLEIKKKYERGILPVSEISEENIEKLKVAYKNEIENNKKAIEETKNKIIEMKEKINNII